ncbi:hypothetical protein FJ959_22275 [Mesorhizobium sp. B2-2-4]|uniref:hypothetical protein n=1 Tax=unclassified Mesorhizobium TaxID=325217 RepID=UPI00112AACC1|nr:MULTISPECIES: hypothetical protein [unclassified Mesorhizobium]TPJ70475.1 hypothetical protein FJ462_07205 [Mesorhizobium sp. B2-6-7]TPJ76868.1 hypothetical protein FJ422_29615 [Mesorhizobium sp. B2-6-3]TPM53259.1 hypothetical protein FJ959_22275 [Mesorhizobium sp. B2-2-4]TPM62098.1 hypothetical protein FJ965_21095 [Mesorhizobium sp. B2-2-1]TPN68469.1 hypothetical protein FJ984_11575 [Mesorhizobium sp. B1-1-3]
MTHPCDIWKVARECGVILREGFEHSPTSRKPFECFCKPTLREIGQEHGEGHLRLVLMLMTGTKPNAAELYADMIKAVSSVLVRKPDLVSRRSLVDDFNAIDLGALRTKARAMNCPVATTDVLRVLLAIRFYEPMQGELLEWRGAA